MWVPGPHDQRVGWSEPAATNAPVEDEAVEAISGMNQNHILPAQSYCFFPSLLCPKNFPSYLPHSHLPPPSYLRLPPPTFPPTSPLLPPTYLLPFIPSPNPGSCWNRSKAGVGAKREQRRASEHLKRDLERELQAPFSFFFFWVAT